MKKTVTWEMYPTTQGRNVNFVICESEMPLGAPYLKIELNPEGREFIEDELYAGPDGKEQLPFIENIIWDLAEDIFCNSGWEIVRPEEVGALTDGLLIADETERDEDGKLIDVGNVFWDESYMIKNLVEDLLEKGYCTLMLGA